MEIVSCTACGRQVNHFQRDALYRHPVLKVLICKVSLCIYQYFYFVFTIAQSTIQFYFYIFCDLIMFLFFFRCLLKYFLYFIQKNQTKTKNPTSFYFKKGSDLAFSP